MVLIAENLACRRAGRRVFAGLSFIVRAGEAAQLTGPNGAGKSSLLRVLAGLIAADSGAVRLGGLTLDGDGFQEHVAYAGHLDAVKPQLGVADNLAFWARLYGAADAGAVARALETFGLARIADLPAAYCSAGQRRRLGLARLPLSGRRLWLLDEPTVSLDAAAVNAFAAVVRAHLAGGGLAVVATHAPLGLEGGPRIVMAAQHEVASAADDPFLGAAWS